MPVRTPPPASRKPSSCLPERRAPACAAGENSCRGAPDEFVKPARLSVAGTILIQESQTGLIEFSEKLIPVDLLEPILFGTEIDAKDAGMSAFLGGPNG